MKASCDASGNRLKVVELEMSYRRIIPNDDEPGSYINFYIANNVIILPIFNDKKSDENAKIVVQTEFPDRKLICLDIRNSNIIRGRRSTLHPATTKE